MRSPSRMITSALVLLSCLLASLDAQEIKLDCSQAPIGSLKTFKDDCRQVVELTDGHSSPLDLASRVDIIENCSCQLLRHPLLWQTMLNKDVDMIFQALQSKASKSNLDGLHFATDDSLFKDNSHGRQVFWWKLNSGIEKSWDSWDMDHVAQTFKVIYGHEGDGIYRSSTASDPLPVMQSACSKLVELMTPYSSHIINLSKLADNPRLVYTLASYDNTLFKVMSVFKICESWQKK